MSKSDRSVQSAVYKTMLLLRSDAENRQDGELIGSEESLISRYGVSRPTLRQAAALVSQEQLVKVRRGVAGGYFAARPAVSAVSHMAAIYLKTRATSMDEMLHAVELIRRNMVRLAAASADSETKAALARFLAQDETAQAGDYSHRQFERAEWDYTRLLGALCGNHVLDLFMQILLELLAMPSGQDKARFYTPARLEAASQRRGRVIRAILDGDSEIAMLEADRGIRQVADWVAETRAGHGSDGARVG